MKTAIVAVITAIVVGAGAFYGGMLYGKNQAQSQVAARLGGRTGPAGTDNANRIGRGVLAGTILQVDAKSVTVKLTAGGSQTAYISAETTITRTTKASTGDLKVGENVIVSGTPGNANEITARSVQIVPAGFSPAGFMGGGRPDDGQTHQNDQGTQNNQGTQNDGGAGPPPGGPPPGFPGP
jgi:hypothetical protein